MCVCVCVCVCVICTDEAHVHLDAQIQQILVFVFIFLSLARRKGITNDADGSKAERRKSEKERRAVYDVHGKRTTFIPFELALVETC